MTDTLRTEADIVEEAIRQSQSMVQSLGSGASVMVEKFNNSMVQIKTLELLKDLKSKLQDNEHTLLTKLNVKDFSELQTKINIWDRECGNFFTKVDSIAAQILPLFGYQQVDENAVKTAFNETFPVIWEEEFTSGNLPEQEEAIIEYAMSWLDDALAEAAKQNSNDITLEGKFGRQKKNLPSKFTVTIVINEKGQRGIKVEFDKNSKLSQSMAIKLAKTLNTKLKEKNIINIQEIAASKDLYTDIYHILQSNGVATGETGQFFTNEILVDSRRNNYNIAKNPAVIKGYLGEVYWNACFSYLSNGVLTQPVGDVKNKRGQSISVDMILFDIGFQIKNYTLKEGVATFAADHKTVPPFLERTDMEANLSNILKMFFSYYEFGYNFPADDLYPTNSYFESSAMASDLNNIFQPYIPNILGIERQFEVNSTGLLPNTFADLNNKLNTVFLIRDRIVPSSLIVDSIINTLINKGAEDIQTKIVTSGYTGKELSRTKDGKGDYDRIKRSLIRRLPGEPTKEFLNLVNKVTFSYEIKLNVYKILEEAEIIAENQGIELK